MSTEIGGNQCLILTPMREDGSVDAESTRRLIDYVVDNGAHGVLALGSTGEGFLLDTSERKEFTELVVHATRGRVPVGVGVESPAAQISVDLSKHAEKAGVDYLFTTAPYRHPHKAVGQFEYFKAVSTATKLPVSIYDGGAAIELSLDLLEKISRELESIKYCKVFLEKPEKIAQIAERTKGRIEPWAGHDRLIYLMLVYGATGLTSAASCVVPRENSDLFNLVRAGNLEEARQLFLTKLAPLNSVAFYSSLDFIALYKMAAYWMGIIATPAVRNPLLQPDETMQRELRATLQYIGKL